MTRMSVPGWAAVAGHLLLGLAVLIFSITHGPRRSFPTIPDLELPEQTVPVRVYSPPTPDFDAVLKLLDPPPTSNPFQPLMKNPVPELRRPLGRPLQMEPKNPEDLLEDRSCVSAACIRRVSRDRPGLTVAGMVENSGRPRKAGSAPVLSEPLTDWTGLLR